MQVFEFNEYEVCLNPLKETVFKDKKFTAKVFLAEKDGQWNYGYDFEIKGLSVGCFRWSGLPGFGKYRKYYASKEDARLAAITVGIRAFKNADSKFNVKPVIAALQRARNPQLSLF